MGSQVRVYRQRIRTVQSTKKITGAMQLIAGSRLSRARQRLNRAQPYCQTMIKVTTTAVSQVGADHPLTRTRESSGRAAILVVTSDRGMAGAYSANVLRTAASLEAQLVAEGKEAVLYVVGRKGLTYYTFRGRPIQNSWVGSTENPHRGLAFEIRDELLGAYLRGDSEAAADAGTGPVVLDEIHIISTKFVNLLTQRVEVRKLLPLKVTHQAAPAEPMPLYDFEPEEDRVLDAVLARYIAVVIALALLDASAAESAARQRAMKSATENAEELINDLTRMVNTARQAEITTEINEIVGGANALAEAGSEYQ